MADIATPNLPARDFEATEEFYAQLGFETGYRDTGWMILHRGEPGNRITLEFFPYPDLDPTQSNFSCCIRLDDLGAVMTQLSASNVPCRNRGAPRYTMPNQEPSGITIAYMIDLDGSLIRLIQND